LVASVNDRQQKEGTDNQAGSTKSQIPNPKQIPNSNDRNASASRCIRLGFGILIIRICLGFVIWDL
jgi:hypothetical protein